MIEFIDSSQFANFGVLGIWTFYLLYEKHKLFSKLTAAIDRLASAETQK